MRQTTCSLSLEVRPERRPALAHLIVALRGESGSAAAGSDSTYQRLLREVPSLHFMSFNIFEANDYDPLLVIEANFGGKPGPFWAQVEAVLGNEIREMLRCCKRPVDHSARLFELITAPGAQRDIAPFLARHTGRPVVFFHGTRGMDRARIEAEATLFTAIQAELGNGSGDWRTLAPQAVHHTLRTRLVPQFPWLNERKPARIAWYERLIDLAKLVVVALLVLWIACLPGITLAAILDDERLIGLSLFATTFAWVRLRSLTKPATRAGKRRFVSLWNAAKSQPVPILLGLVALFLVGWPATMALDALASGRPFDTHKVVAARQMAWAIYWLAAIELPFILIWLRRLEKRDTSLRAPQIKPTKLASIAEFEDWVPQNHMGSLVPLRPQILRRVFVFVLLPIVHLALRAFARDGYLGSMRTIHFAQWSLVNNGSRLLFVSNFDQSWESYFDDFIEKAHEGLTLIWGVGVGFPPTTMLVGDGAAQGRLFKSWARHSMAASPFWVSAYPDYTVDQIDRNGRIADGLRSIAPRGKALSDWVALL